MTEFAAEDFAQATLATRGEHEFARRVMPDEGWQWLTEDGGWLSDVNMAHGGWTPVMEARPITLDALAAAYAAAEVPTGADPIRAGDVCLVFLGATWIAGEVGDRWWPVRDARILSRAPREPWQGLADDLADRSALMDEDAIEAAAKALHAAGWRKGGDDDE